MEGMLEPYFNYMLPMSQERHSYPYLESRSKEFVKSFIEGPVRYHLHGLLQSGDAEFKAVMEADGGEDPQPPASSNQGLLEAGRVVIVKAISAAGSNCTSRDVLDAFRAMERGVRHQQCLHKKTVNVDHVE
jgi:hypothetical protein